jgi:hypothetical protein
MATNALIGLRVGPGIRAIYCHYEGDIRSVGKMLYEHYNDREKVEALIKGGDISFLEPRIDAPPGHSFSNPVPGYTVFYARDRGEALKVLFFQNLSKFLAYGRAFPYVYLYDNDRWLVSSGNSRPEELWKVGGFPPPPPEHHELHTDVGPYDEAVSVDNAYMRRLSG